MGRLLSFFFALMVFPAVAFASGQVGEYVQVGDGYLGSAATRDAEDTMTDGANLPDGAAIKAYGDANWQPVGDFITALTGDVTASGPGSVAATIGADKVHDSMIDWGTGASQVSAVDMPIADGGSIITATDVEAALQEHRTAINLNTAKDTNVSTNLSLGAITATTMIITSSDGTDATLVEADTDYAGLLGAGKWDEIVANSLKDTMVYPGVGIAVSTGSAWSASIATPIAVGQGGIGIATLAEGVLFGNGTSPITSSGILGNGTIVIGDGAGLPTYSAAFTGSSGPLKGTYGGLQINTAGWSNHIPVITSGVATFLTNNSTNWNTAYTDRLKWDGGATGLTASTGRSSLGLGTAATRNAEDSLTDGSNLPDGHAIKTYGDANWTSTGMTYPGAGIALSTGSAWSASVTNNSANWNTAYTDRLKWSGASTGLTAATGRTSLGIADMYTYGINSEGNSGDIWVSDGSGRGAWETEIGGGAPGVQTVGNIASYGAVSNATVSSGVVSGTNDLGALIAAYAAGFRQFFIPRNTRIKLNSGSWVNTIPAGVTIYGEEWDTVYLETSTPNSDQLTIGVDTILHDVAIYSKFGYDLLSDNNMPNAYNEPRPVRMFANNTGATRQVSTWYKGNVHAEQGQGSGSPTTVSNYAHYDWPANSVANYGSGDCFWAGSTWNASCFRADVGGGRGFYAPLGSTFITGQTHPAGTAVPSYGVLVTTQASRVNSNSYMIYTRAATDHAGLTTIAGYNTTRDILISDESSVKTTGAGLQISYGNASYSGYFIDIIRNSVRKYSVNGAGNVVSTGSGAFAGGVSTGSAGMYATGAMRADGGLSIGVAASALGTRILTTSPSFWLEDSTSGGSSLNFVNDGNYFQIQKRNTSFGSLINNLMYIDMRTGATYGDMCVYGDLTSGATCDFVFGPDHEVPTIDEVDEHIKEYNKLPGLTEPDGVRMSDLMVKTEEQALYIIQLHKRVNILEVQMESVLTRLDKTE